MASRKKVLARRVGAQGDLEAAATAAVRWTRQRPWSERACRAVMELELARGESTAALHVFGQRRQGLGTEFQVSPTAPTLALAAAKLLLKRAPSPRNA